MKKALYTINFNGYDSLREPLVLTKGWDYVVFSDQDIESKHFEVRKFKVDRGGHLAARDFYINSQKYLPEYDKTVMIGGQIQVNCNLDDFIKLKCRDADINLMNHCRSCTYKEAEENKKFFGDKGRAMIERQMADYREDGFPKDFGLFAHGIIVRGNNDNIAEHEWLWWQEVKNPEYVTRDQLSFMYILWKHRLVTTHGFNTYWDILHKEFHIYKHGTDQKL